MADTKKPATNVWTDEERAAMKESARERKASGKRNAGDERAAGEQDIRDAIAKMPEPDHGMAERLHEIVTQSAPELMPRTWYGMPAYTKAGKTICFFKAKSKFKDRYSTLGFETSAALDDGPMFPCAYALMELTPAVEKRIAEFVKKAAS